ncbi:hypothetical protein GY45DRAFT_1295942 [Cubamyces sp. BRFM 1775]|nr:hypothetical protein GY45DRAFT_1295942 [Cubamyces sp. BRFM 1775]
MPTETTRPAALPSVIQAESILSPSNASTSLNLYRTVVLPAEEAASHNAGKHQDAQTQLIQVRVVGYLLLYCPSPCARQTLEAEVASCGTQPDTHAAVFELGAKYIKHLIVIFRKSRGRTSTPESSLPSPSSLGRLVQDHLSDMQRRDRAPRDHSSAKAFALIRDNYRCIVTGRMDSVSSMAELTELAPGETFGYTICCHIFPDSLGDVVAGATGPNLEHEPATVRDILTSFGYQVVCEELGLGSTNANLHRLENVMTLDIVLRNELDRLNMWFEAIDGQQKNTYKIVLAGRAERLASANLVPEQVTFTSHYPELSLPSPKYLRIHAACFRIAHLSGAAEHLDHIFREMEELKVLALDGTFADVLAYALHTRLAALV